MSDNLTAWDQGCQVKFLKYGDSEFSYDNLELIGDDDVVAEFDTSDIEDSSLYTFVVSLSKNDRTEEDRFTIYFNRDIKSGWPSKFDKVLCVGILCSFPSDVTIGNSTVSSGITRWVSDINTDLV